MKLKVLSICSTSGLGFMIYRNRTNCRENVQKNEDFTLKQVQIVFRHGARTPLFEPKYLTKASYPGDLLNHANHTVVPIHPVTLDGKPYTDYDPKKSKTKFFGSITATGAEQMYNLGRRIQQKYVHEMRFLPAEHTDEVYVRSTRVPRAIESARCTLAGLFPGTREPILIETASDEHEVMYPNFNRCKYLKLISRWAWVNPDLIQDMKDMREEFQLAYKISSDETMHIVTLRDCIVSQKFHGVLPTQYDIPVVENDLENAALKIMHHVFAGEGETGDLRLKLGIGPLLGVFLDNMFSHIHGTTPKKLLLFSGHDTTLMPLLHALGINEKKWPPFGADITLELYERKEDKMPFVRVLYLNKECVVQGCTSAMCPLDEFHRALSQFVISEDSFIEQCGIENDHLLQSLPKL